MTDKQMLNRGFTLVDLPMKDKYYSFNDVCFIPETSIYTLRSKQVSLLIYEAGLKQGRIQGKNERTPTKRNKKIKHNYLFNNH